MGTMDQNVLKIRMLNRNIFPLTGKRKYTYKGNHFLCKTVPNAKDSQKLGIVEIHIIRKKRKISVLCFQSKFEVQKKKTIFTMIQFLLLPFLKKLVRFPVLLLSTHTQRNAESSRHICVLHHGQ